MEREIIFRGKELGIRDWAYGDLTNLEIDGKEYAKIGRFYVDPSTVGQYTGLTDRNGVKIFEGDILKWDNEWPDYCEVARWDYELLDMRKNDWPQFCEVIGNYWDTPELLEVKK